VEKLEDEQYDTVEAELDDLASQIQHAETQIANRIQQLRIERQDTATAMRRLNERVERTDGGATGGSGIAASGLELESGSTTTHTSRSKPAVPRRPSTATI